MHRLAILFCAPVPSLVLLQYGIAKAHAGWGNGMIWQAFFTGGFAAAFVGILAEIPLKAVLGVKAMAPVHGAVTEAFLVAAIPEEIVKLAAVFFVIKRYGDGTKLHDMITLSLAVALGFAMIENLGYFGSFGDLQHLGLSRSLLTAPVHALLGLAMGSFLMGAQLFRATVAASSLPLSRCRSRCTAGTIFQCF
jgi:RsiW-degrading membrane proteinase PrsW (M82 family)